MTQANVGRTICVTGWTRTVRPPVSVTGPLKTKVMAAYGISDDPANWELDHLIPLELGGDPGGVGEVANIWPEPWEARGARRAPPGTGAESKDRLENALHQRVCAGTLPLAEAQHAIATDWYAALQSYVGPR